MGVRYVDCCRGSDEVWCQNWASVSMGTWVRCICLRFTAILRVLWGASLRRLRLEGPLFQTPSRKWVDPAPPRAGPALCSQVAGDADLRVPANHVARR